MILEWIKEGLGFGLVEQAGTSGRFEVYAIRLPLHPDAGSPALIDDGTVYIGSGVYPTRKEEHLKVARRKLKTAYGRMRLSHKEKILIWAEDHAVTVQYVTLWRTDNREEAYCAEKRTIEYYGIERLTNEVYGRCNDRAVRLSTRKDAFCRVCGVPLDVDVNIPARRYARKDYICKACSNKQAKEWKRANSGSRQEEYSRRVKSKQAAGMCMQGCGRSIGNRSRYYCDVCEERNRVRANNYYAKKRGEV